MVEAGSSRRETRTLRQADFDAFARFSGDANPIHVDPDYAAGTRFGRTVSHGMLLYALLDAVAKRLLPGSRAIAQALQFPEPTFADEPLTLTATVDAVDGQRVHLTLTAAREKDDAATCVGPAVYELGSTP